MRFDDDYDDESSDFEETNELLWKFSKLDESIIDESESVYDYVNKHGLSENMISLVNAGYSNTLCSNSTELSMKQCIKWSKCWDEESPEVSETSGLISQLN